MSNLNQLIAEYKEARAAFEARAKAAFNVAVQEFFKNNPEVKCISWTQYSPFFNDGEECVFSVHEPQFANFIPDADSCGYSLEAEEEGQWVYGDRWDRSGDGVPDSIPEADAIASFIQSSEVEDLMQDMFGNHVRVIVTAEGIETTDYDHD